MYNIIKIIFILTKMNFKYGNSNNNIFQNLNMNNINNQNNLNMNHSIGMNSHNNNTMNILLQYINLMNLNKLNKNQLNINTTNSNINNNINNKNIQNPLNILQLMPNIIKFGFNQPYSFSNTKKESSIIHPSDFKNKLYYKNKEPFPNNFNNKDFDSKSDDECNERKFMRKMTKAEKIEIDKWFEARKKLYPTKKNIELKKKIGEIKVEKGLVSDLELKLRKKVNILKKLNSSKRIKIRNKFNKEFPNFQKRKKEILEKKQQSNKNEENKIDKTDNNNQSNNDNTQNDKEKEDILEDGEIKEEISSKINEEEINYKNNEENNKENNQKIIGKKRERKNNNIKKKLGKNKIEIKENKNEYGFKKGFKYKSNNLYDELIKKEKIKEQNILLQAIRYLINLKED